jgi:hypothetical protein
MGPGGRTDLRVSRQCHGLQMSTLHLVILPAKKNKEMCGFVWLTMGKLMLK